MPTLIGSADRTTAKMARDVILYALFVRQGMVTDSKSVTVPSRENDGQQDTSEMIRSYLHSERPSPQLFRYLRKILGQSDGPNIVTLLAILPSDYLNVVQTILAYYVGYVEQSPTVRDQMEKNDHAGSISALFRN